MDKIEKDNMTRLAVELDPDVINLARFDASLRRFLDRYPDGAPNGAMIAKALCMSENDVEKIFQDSMAELREFF